MIPARFHRKHYTLKSHFCGLLQVAIQYRYKKAAIQKGRCFFVCRQMRPVRGATRISGVALQICFHFNPRTPYGVRHNRLEQELRNHTFQSTHPMRGATTGLPAAAAVGWISIHAPHAGCDSKIAQKSIVLIRSIVDLAKKIVLCFSTAL